jgi:hypothetical protein
MTKRTPSPQPRDLAELMLLGGAVLLGFRGRDPAQIAALAQASADKARALIQTLERAAENHFRSAAGCRAPDACQCVVCTTEGAGQS